MWDKSAFNSVSQNISKYEILLHKRTIPLEESKQKCKSDENVDETKNTVNEEVDEEREKELLEELIRLQTGNKFAVFQTINLSDSPYICIWTYMGKEELELFLQIESKRKIKKVIDVKIGQEFPKGVGRILLVELVYNVLMFTKVTQCTLEQTGAVLSMFYLAHRYFTSSLYISAEQIYNYFKSFMFLHCLKFPPESVKIFDYAESRLIVLFFLKIYLKNLPLIRLLVLPNYAFYLNYEKEPDPVVPKPKKKGKDKKGKGKKGKGKK